MALLDTLLNYYTLDEASGNRASSNTSDTLTDTNTVGSATGKISLAADFIAANSEYLTIASNARFVFGPDDPFTISCWVNGDTLSGTQSVLGKWASSGSVATCEWAIRLVASEFVLRVGDGTNNGTVSASNYVTNVGAFATGTWYKLCVWHDPTADVIGIRVNANDSQGKNTLAWTTGILAGTANFSMGRMGDFDGQYWDGLIDEVGIWRRVLTADEDTTLYNGGAGLTYPFGELSAPINRGLILAGRNQVIPNFLMRA